MQITHFKASSRVSISKFVGKLTEFRFIGSAIYYTGEINSGASAVEILIDSVSYSILNISHQARVKGIKSTESDVEILFSAENLDPKSIHTFTLKDYGEKNEKEKFITLYRLTLVAPNSFYHLS